MSKVKKYIAPTAKILRAEEASQPPVSAKKELLIAEYSFKKSHSIGYAHAIVVQMNLVCEKISYGYS